MNRLVVLGRFGGLAATQRLDHIFRYDEDVDVTLISGTSVLLCTPMLADVAGGTIEPHYAVLSLRRLPSGKARFQEAVIQAFDVAAQKVKATCARGDLALVLIATVYNKQRGP
jgi:NADH dehydrogenase FAD-containing subunit